MSNRKLIIFRMSPEKKKALKNIAAVLRMDIIEVAPRDYEQKLGYLAGISGFARQPGNYKGMEFPKEMLIFSGIDSKTMDLFLDAYKKTGLEKIELKAAITMTNINWTPKELFSEILKENLFMSIR